MARLGAEMTGIDITEKNLQVARMHAQLSALEIDYRLASVEHLAGEGTQFDVVLNMEVVEHVEHLQDFLADCARLVRPGGIMVVASINRTPAAWFIAILGAEQILRWLPRGTHHYHKLVRPAEIAHGLGAGYRLRHETGMRMNPFNRRFGYTRWKVVNYMMVWQRQA